MAGSSWYWSGNTRGENFQPGWATPADKRQGFSMRPVIITCTRCLVPVPAPQHTVRNLLVPNLSCASKLSPVELAASGVDIVFQNWLKAWDWAFIFDFNFSRSNAALPWGFAPTLTDDFNLNIPASLRSHRCQKFSPLWCCAAVNPRVDPGMWSVRGCLGPL